MSSIKRYLLIGIAVAAIGAAVGCGQQPGFTTYINDIGGYSVSYPANWVGEISKDSTLYVIKSPSHLASVRIDVIMPMSAQSAAQRWIIAMGTGYSDFALLENKPLEGFWNWYVSYDYQSDIGRYHGEAYFKSTPDHVYKLDTAGDAGGYDTYPFSAIVSSFKLE